MRYNYYLTFRNTNRAEREREEREREREREPLFSPYMVFLISDSSWIYFIHKNTLGSLNDQFNFWPVRLSKPLGRIFANQMWYQLEVWWFKQERWKRVNKTDIFCCMCLKLRRLAEDEKKFEWKFSVKVGQDLFFNLKFKMIGLPGAHRSNYWNKLWNK